MKTGIKYFKDVNVNNKVIFEFDVDYLNFDGDDVVVGNNVDVDNVGRIVNFSNLSNKKSERVDINNLGIKRSVRVDEAGDEYVEYEEEDDFIPYNEEWFKFVNEIENEQIDSLEGDLCSDKILDGLESENEWKISSDKDDFDGEGSAKSYSSCEKGKDKVEGLGRRIKTRRLIPHLAFNARYLKCELMDQ